MKPILLTLFNQHFPIKKCDQEKNMKSFKKRKVLNNPLNV